MPRTPAHLVAVLLPWLALATPALATVADDVCPPADDPCVVQTDVPIETNSVLDFGSRELRIKKGSLTVGGGIMTIRARRLVLESRGALLAQSTIFPGGTITVELAEDLEIQAANNLEGKIDATGTSGGGISVSAGGDLVLNGPVGAAANDNEGFGGDVTLAGNNVTFGVRADIDVNSGTDADGGNVDVQALGTLTIAGRITAAGGSDSVAGNVTLQSGSDLTTSDTIDASGNLGVFGSGGFIEIDAGGNLVLGGPIYARSVGGGSGGIVYLSADGDVTIGKDVLIPGSTPDGFGGALEINAGGSFTQLSTADIEVDAPGAAGEGGSFTLRAPLGGTVRDVSVNGGAGGGSVLIEEIHGPLAIAGRVSADGTGAITSGGRIDLVDTGDVTVSGHLHAGAPVTQPGGMIRVAGCGITIVQNADVTVTAQNSLNELRGSGLVYVVGDLQAGATNRIYYRDVPPSIPAPNHVQPAAFIQNDPTLAACFVAPTTTTTSSTTTTTTTTSTTSTTTTSTTTTTVTTSSTTTATTTTGATTTATTSTSPSTTTTRPTTTTTRPTTSTTSTTTATTTSSTSTSTTTRPPTTTPTTTLRPTTTSTSTSTTTTTTAAPACLPGDACDDGDLCTDDACVAGECTHDAKTGAAAVGCRLDTMAADVEGAPAGSIVGKKLERRIADGLAKARSTFASARDVTGKKAVKRMRRTVRLVTGVQHAVDRGTSQHKIALGLGRELSGLATDVRNRVSALVSKGP